MSLRKRPDQHAPAGNRRELNEWQENRDALQQKRRKRRKRRLTFSFCFVILLALLVWLIYAFVRVNEVQVQGNSQFTAEQVFAVSGIQTGQHIFTIDKRQVKTSIESNPYLVFKNIYYIFPDGIRISVSERTAVAGVTDGGKTIVFDEEGIVLEILSGSATNSFSLPLIQGVRITGFEPGRAIKTDDAYKQTVVEEVLEALKLNNIAKETQQLDFTDVNSITVTMRSGMILKLGQSVDMNKKIAWALAVMQNVESEQLGVGTIDASTPGNVSYRPAEATTSPQSSPSSSPAP